MKKTLIPKLIFGYVLFVALGFIILCTFTQHAITHYAENREAQQLYRESVQIASGYADNYNKYSFSLQDFQKQMQSLGEYLSAQIWIMDNQGNILFDYSATDFNHVESAVSIADAGIRRLAELADLPVRGKSFRMK